MLSRFTGTVLLASLTVLVPAAAALPTLERTIAPGAGAFNGLEMALADFRGDGHLQVVAQSDDGSVYVLDPRTGATLARFAPGNAGCTSACYGFEGVSGPINAPQVTDMDGDGLLDVVVANTAAVVARYEFNGAASTATKFVFDKKWEHRYNNYQSFTTMDANPVVADLNGDGSKDIVVVTEEVGVFAVRADGSTLWALGVAGGHASPSVRDLDGDGRPEVVIARDDGIVEARSGSNGASKWTFDARSYVRPASVPMAPTLSDITGDGRPDVLFMARDAHDAGNFALDHAMMFALDHAGKLLWRFQPSWAPPLSHTRPVVVSVGGQLAVLGGTWNTIGHKPGNFERVGAGQVFLLDAQGRETWHRDLNAGSSNKDLAVADVVGDGSQQVIAPGTSGGKTGWLLFDLATGAPRGFLAAPTPTRSGAAVGDLFGDGRFAMVAAVQASGGSVQVWHGTQGLSSAFPGWGAVKIAHGTPSAGGGGGGSGGSGGGGTGGNGTGALTATFTPKGNEWWVEAIVSANHPIASVSATVNGGAPVDLPKTSWGTWAKS
ncbi:MAG TPA: FG-GAP-like repeat-containing protein, partial [Candidatus Thermoplasmatota archaeon]|nr:FG-GAP-like repeat-containing protein [Candidatus Thermoplasmatota archaeon]